MKPPRAPGRRGRALWAAFALPAVASADPSGGVPQAALHACAVIAAASERLACYDQLSGRAAPGTAASTSASTAAVTAAPAGAAPVRPPAESFGLYAAEHPAAPPLPASLQERVVALGRSESGRTTVTLEGGQLWELQEADPLLAVGDTVTVRRASLGSYMMETPSKRSHRARRLR